MNLAEQFYDTILTTEEFSHIEKATKMQARYNMWFQERSSLITASNFKPACRTSVETPSFIVNKNDICYPTQFLFKTKATMWSVNLEKNALSAFVTHAAPLHQGLHLHEVGLCVSPNYLQFGATPDAMVTCDCCGIGCVEVNNVPIDQLKKLLFVICYLR